MRMFASIAETPLPDNALLQRYVRSGDYTDCFSTRVDTVVSLPQYINAFYTTGIFKTERVILKWLVSRPSTDEDVRQLADASCDTFAAWSVQD
ncbi:MAG: hypothetical protein KJO82_00435, partial [Gammaproteobacteria bacterium]|nr:hypothetical protein [Gammaproteobacteria bacterium]